MALLHHLPEARRQRVSHALRREKALQLYSASLLLGYVLHAYGKTPEDVQLTPEGKPYLADGPCFNLSHSGQYVALALDQSPVGVDLQEKKPLSHRAATLFLGLDATQSAGEDTTANTAVWCRKEAFLKCIGLGWNGTRAAKLRVNADRLLYEKQEYFLRDYPILEDYFLTLCTVGSQKDFEIREVGKDELAVFYGAGQCADPGK